MLVFASMSDFLAMDFILRLHFISNKFISSGRQMSCEYFAFFVEVFNMILRLIYLNPLFFCKQISCEFPTFIWEVSVVLRSMRSMQHFEK